MSVGGYRRAKSQERVHLPRRVVQMIVAANDVPGITGKSATICADHFPQMRAPRDTVEAGDLSATRCVSAGGCNPDLRRGGRPGMRRVRSRTRLGRPRRFRSCNPFRRCAALTYFFTRRRACWSARPDRQSLAVRARGSPNTKCGVVHDFVTHKVPLCTGSNMQLHCDTR
jgi:hypothetical protein